MTFLHNDFSHNQGSAGSKQCNGKNDFPQLSWFNAPQALRALYSLWMTLMLLVGGIKRGISIIAEESVNCIAISTGKTESYKLSEASKNDGFFF